MAKIENSDHKIEMRVINLDEDDDILDTPGKQKFMSHNKEESSYLPMNVNPEKLAEKKKIIKKVRFHDDDPIVVTSQPLDQPKVGTKRTLMRAEEHSDDHEEEFPFAEECDREFHALEWKNLKRQKKEASKELKREIKESNEEVVTTRTRRAAKRHVVHSEQEEEEDFSESEEEVVVKPVKVKATPVAK